MTFADNPIALWLVLVAVLAGLVFGFLRQELRVRAMVYGTFLLACAVSVWPPYDHDGKPGKIKRGLDLKGGIHLVLQVVTDDALTATTDDAAQGVRDKLTRQGITYAKVERKDARSFSVEGVEGVRVKDARNVLSEFRVQGWELSEPVEGSFGLRLGDTKVKDLKVQTVQEEIRTLERRVNVLGVAEPVIGEYGSAGDQILVQLPGVTDVEEAKRVIRRTAQLSLRLVVDSAATKEALLQNYQGKAPDDMEVAVGSSDSGNSTVYYLIRKESVVTGRDLKNARAGVSPQDNAPDVEFTLNAAGAERFARATEQNIGRRLAIILDNMVYSAPSINSRISESGIITGHFTLQEADELAKVLKAGALPATLRFQQELTVGASLGKDSIRAGVTATIAGAIFLFAFMLIYYRLSGLNAIVALSANLLILLGSMAYFGATLTLPGIAGIILTVGVGVDTNVLVFERIREELRNGKTVKAAIANGFDRVFLTIVDTHATALIAAVFLFQFGTGPIKGFAVTLFGGLVANVFASFFVSRFLFDWIIGKRQVATLSI
jgi:preprotein translocase subunit SecD